MGVPGLREGSRLRGPGRSPNPGPPPGSSRPGGRHAGLAAGAYPEPGRCWPAAPGPGRTVGTVVLALGTLGLWHLAAGGPADALGRARAAGAVGYLVAEPLVDGFTVWVAVPLLALLAGYGLLVLTGTPVRAVP